MFVSPQILCQAQNGFALFFHISEGSFKFFASCIHFLHSFVVSLAKHQRLIARSITKYCLALLFTVLAVCPLPFFLVTCFFPFFLAIFFGFVFIFFFFSTWIANGMLLRLRLLPVSKRIANWMPSVIVKMVVKWTLLLLIIANCRLVTLPNLWLVKLINHVYMDD